MRERRRHVRTKPDPSLPARAVRTVDALLRESLDVIDISVGGMALATRPIDVGTRMTLTVTLGAEPERAIEVEVRWAATGMIGVEFVDPSHETSHAVQRYVAELLERGASV
jgi:hypothetical protein